MTTLSPEKEAELREILQRLHNNKISASSAFGQVFLFISTERQAREAAEKEVERLNFRLENTVDAYKHSLRVQEAAEAKLAALPPIVAGLRFDLRMQCQFGPDYHQAIKDNLDKLAALSALLPPVPTEEACEHLTTKRGGAIWTVCEDCGRKWADDEIAPTQAPQDVAGLVEVRDWIVRTREKAKAAQDIIGERGITNVFANEHDVRANWNYRYGYQTGMVEATKDVEAMLSRLAALRPSPISHEDRPLELAAADNNRELVEALTKSEGAMDIASAFLRGVREHSPSEALDMLQNSITDARARCAVALAAFQSRQEGKAS